MKLERIYIDNYKCLVNFELKFEDLTVLLGPNGSGKSTVFDALTRLGDLVARQDAVAALFRPRTTTRWMTHDRQTIEIETSDSYGRFVYRLVIEHDEPRERARIAEERLTLDGRPLFEFVGGDVQLYRDDHSKGPPYPFDWGRSGLATILPRRDNQKLSHFKSWLSGIVVVRPVPRLMSSAVLSDQDIDFVDNAAQHFASWYYHLALNRQDVAFALTQCLRDVLPGFVTLNLPERGGGRVLEAQFDVEGSTIRLDFDELSDGQRELVLLYGLLAGYRRTGLTLFIDEPTTSLALQEVQPWAMELADACLEGDLQAVIISHHPAMIDYLASRQAIWMEREGSGPVRAQLLEEKHVEGGLRISELIARRWIP